MVLKLNSIPDYLESFHFTVANYVGSVEYTVPEDGYYHFSALITDWKGTPIININNKQYRTHYMYYEKIGYNTYSVYFDLECKKGDVINVSNQYMYSGALIVYK